MVRHSARALAVPFSNPVLNKRSVPGKLLLSNSERASGAAYAVVYLCSHICCNDLDFDEVHLYSR